MPADRADDRAARRAFHRPRLYGGGNRLLPESQAIDAAFHRALGGERSDSQGHRHRLAAGNFLARHGNPQRFRAAARWSPFAAACRKSSSNSASAKSTSASPIATRTPRPWPSRWARRRASRSRSITYISQDHPLRLPAICCRNRSWAFCRFRERRISRSFLWDSIALTQLSRL